MLWLMELLADEALPEITQPVHEEGVSLQGTLHWKVLAPCPVFCVRLSCWGRCWGCREESSLEALSWRQRQLVAPASGGQGMRLRSGLRPGWRKEAQARPLRFLEASLTPGTQEPRSGSGPQSQTQRSHPTSKVKPGGQGFSEPLLLSNSIPAHRALSCPFSDLVPSTLWRRGGGGSRKCPHFTVPFPRWRRPEVTACPTASRGWSEDSSRGLLACLSGVLAMRSELCEGRPERRETTVNLSSYSPPPPLQCRKWFLRAEAEPSICGGCDESPRGESCRMTRGQQTWLHI